MIWKDAREYEGGYENDMRTGRGVMRWPKGKYNCHTHFLGIERGRTTEDIQTMVDGLIFYGAKGCDLVCLIPRGHNVLDAVLLLQRKVSFERLGSR